MKLIVVYLSAYVPRRDPLARSFNRSYAVKLPVSRGGKGEPYGVKDVRSVSTDNARGVIDGLTFWLAWAGVRWRRRWWWFGGKGVVGIDIPHRDATTVTQSWLCAGRRRGPQTRLCAILYEIYSDIHKDTDLPCTSMEKDLGGPLICDTRGERAWI